MFPDELPTGPAYDDLVKRLKDNDLIRGKLLAEDGTLTLAVMSLDPAFTHAGKLGAVVDDIRKTIAEDLQGTGLKADLSGVPIMQLQIRRAVERDRIDYNAVGFALGCLVAILFFRRLSFLVIATAPPLAAILMSLGAIGWMGLKLNMFLNVMTPLIMVISFSDSMQLTFAARDRLIEGESRRAAFRWAILTVGPACVLTHATAALSFLALRFSDSDMIRAFGLAGVVSMGIALVTVLVVLPALGVLIAPTGKRVASLSRVDTGVDALRAFCDWIADRMTRRPGLVSLGALVVLALLEQRLFRPGAALPPRRPGARPRARHRRHQPHRRQARRRQSRRRDDHLPARRRALFAGDAGGAGAGAASGGDAAGHRQCLVVADPARLAAARSSATPTSRRCANMSTICRASWCGASSPRTGARS